MPVEVITAEDLQEALRPLLKRIAQLEGGLTQWVSTKEAVRITGMGRTTLHEERSRAGTLIKYRKEGRTVTYNRKSLIDYCEK